MQGTPRKGSIPTSTSTPMTAAKSTTHPPPCNPDWHGRPPGRVGLGSTPSTPLHFSQKAGPRVYTPSTPLYTQAGGQESPTGRVGLGSTPSTPLHFSQKAGSRVYIPSTPTLHFSAKETLEEVQDIVRKNSSEQEFTFEELQHQMTASK